MKKIFLISVLLIAIIGCQANLLDTPTTEPSLSDINYHNEFVENINEIITQAEITISNYNDFAITNDPAILQDGFEALRSQVEASTNRLNELAANEDTKTDGYHAIFTNEYLKVITKYLTSYEKWIKQIELDPTVTNDPTLENNYSQFVQTHNFFVNQINGQI